MRAAIPACLAAGLEQSRALARGQPRATAIRVGQGFARQGKLAENEESGGNGCGSKERGC